MQDIESLNKTLSPKNILEVRLCEYRTSQLSIPARTADIKDLHIAETKNDIFRFIGLPA